MLIPFQLGRLTRNQLESARRSATGVAVILDRRGDPLAARIFRTLAEAIDAEGLRRIRGAQAGTDLAVDGLEDADPHDARRARGVAAWMAQQRRDDTDMTSGYRELYAAVTAALASFDSHAMRELEHARLESFGREVGH